MYSLIEMLRYKRPEGSVEQRQFCKRFLEPVFGPHDGHGNYILVLGDEPNVAFMAHHDTVHREGGMQNPIVENNIVSISEGCLGADCTTGVYIILNMIENNIPGVYVIHAGEEIGCVGSSGIVQDMPLWLEGINIAISFDRWGTDSIVTHQLGERTCSYTFALSLADQLNMGHKPDNTGVYTDSNEYRGVVAECTNISVGYYNQHKATETQDLDYLDRFIAAILQVDWSKLEVDRTPRIDYDDRWNMIRHYDYVEKEDQMYNLVRDNPQLICDYLTSYGVTVSDLEEELYNNTKYGFM